MQSRAHRFLAVLLACTPAPCRPAVAALGAAAKLGPVAVAPARPDAAGTRPVGWAAAEPVAPQPEGELRMVSMPAEIYGYRVYLAVTVNGRGPYSFVIDTASPLTLVDRSVAADLGLEFVETGRVSGAGEGSSPIGTVGPVTLEFGGHTISSVQMACASFNGPIGNFAGRPLDGIIGNDWLGRRVFSIDYAGGRVTFIEGPWSPGDGGVPVPIEVRGHVYAAGSLTPEGGDPIHARWVIDTGAGMSAMLSSHFVGRHGLMPGDFDGPVAMLGRGMGGDVRAGVARAASITIGPVVVDRPWIGMSNDRAGAFASRAMDGVIGGEILSRYTVTFDGPGGRMILDPTDRADDPMEWDMSGMTITGDGEGGMLCARFVLEGGPAHAAGVREGDLLLSIDGRPLTARDRDVARDLLRSAGHRRRLVLRRGSETVEVDVELRRLVWRDAEPARGRAPASVLSRAGATWPTAPRA